MTNPEEEPEGGPRSTPGESPATRGRCLDTQDYELWSAAGEFLRRVVPEPGFVPTWFTLERRGGFVPDEFDVPYVVRHRILC